MIKPSKSIVLLLFALLCLSSCRKKGCTIESALNFDKDAKVDNGSCEFKKGCTDCTAHNYDASAKEDDGSCSYEQRIPTGFLSTTYNIIDSSSLQKTQQQGHLQIRIEYDFCITSKLLITLHPYPQYKSGDRITLSATVEGEWVTIPDQIVTSQIHPNDPSYHFFSTQSRLRIKQGEQFIGTLYLWYEYEGKRFSSHRTAYQ